MSLEQQQGFFADEDPTDRANLRIRLERTRLDEDFKRRQVPLRLRLIAALAGLIRYLVSKLRP